ncbi:MAG: transglutaminase-like domain-containing protein [Candidatus Acidiferrum sp.]
MKLPGEKHLIFRVVWRGVNVLLAVVLLSSVYAGAREYSVRQYLRGFSDAVVPESAGPEQKVEAILGWMRNGPSRYVAVDPSELSMRDPETTLNYKQLLAVCGTATNAFLNLARSGGLSVRRLLLLTPQHNTKHVVAEVWISGRWVIVDPTYRVMLRDEQGQLLTLPQLRNSAMFEEAVSKVPGYPREYNYEHYAHVRLARLPLDGMGLRQVLDRLVPGWDEAVDWSLLLERESFLILVVSLGLTLFFLLLRAVLAWYADSRLRVPRFHLREHALRAGVAFFSTPEIKQ